MAEHELIIRNARLHECGDLVDIAIDLGRISAIGVLSDSAELEIDAGGCIVAGAFIIPHLHLCKVYTLSSVGEEALRHYQSVNMENSYKAIELAREVKKRYSVNWVYENAKKAVMEAVKYGCLTIRGFADVDSLAGLKAVEALLKLREEIKDIVKLQVVAFPQEGIVREPKSSELLWKAAEMGCDVIGGIPWIENTEEDMAKHISLVFDIATTLDKDVTMLTDDAGDQTLRTTELLTLETRKRRWIGRVSACHARALALYPKPRLARLADLMRACGVSVVISPHTGSLLAPVKDLVDNGVNVALGQDDIEDAYYPFGRGNMLEVIFLAAHLFKMMDSQSLNLLFNMTTVNAARVIRLQDYGIAVGKRADLMVLDSSNIREAVKNHNPPIYVISQGRIVAENGALKQNIKATKHTARN